MATSPSAQKIFDALLTKYGKAIAQAFLDAINDLRSGADLSALSDAISRGDIQAAIDALHLDPAAMAPLDKAIGDAYAAGGQYGATTIQTAVRSAGLQFVVRFNGRNLRAENWLRDHSSQLVTDILDDQRASVRAVLQAGMEAGSNPRTTALDIIGRINRATGKREGGILGLTSQQAEYVRSAQAELASGDPALLRNYLTRTLRDRRFDSVILRAIEDGDIIPVKTIQSAAGSYANRLLKLRGDTIARTESLTALHTAQEEAFHQAIDAGTIKASDIRNTWRSAGDDRVRHTHTVLNGETVGQGQAFTSPSGARLRYPGDTSLGAPPSEIINCRCLLQKRINFLNNIQ